MKTFLNLIIKNMLKFSIFFVFLIFTFNSSYSGNELDDCKRLASYPVNNDFEYGVNSIDTDEQALEIIRVCEQSINNNPEEGEYYLNLARAYYFLGDHQKEMELLNLALENNYYDRVYFDLSDLYLNGLHDQQNQLPDINKSIDLLFEGDKKGDHASQYLLGFYYLFGDFEEILGPANIDTAIEYFEKSKNDNLYSFLEYTLRAMPIGEQVGILNQTIALYDENKDLHQLPLGWINYHLSDVYSRNYQYVEQIISAKNTIKFISSAYGEDYIGLSSDYQLLAEAYMRRGLLGEADNNLNKAFFILNSNNYTNFEYEYFELVYTYAELAVAYNQDEKAYNSFNEIKNYFESSDRGFALLEGYTYFYLADYYLLKKDIEKAGRYITKAETILEPYKDLSFYYDGFTDIKIDYLYLSKNEKDLKNFLNSYEEYYEKSEEQNSFDTSSLLTFKYIISKYDYLSNDPQKCIEELSSNLKLIEINKINQSTSEFDNLIILGSCYRALSKDEEAFKTYIQALKIKNYSFAVRERFYPKHDFGPIYEFIFQYSIENNLFNEDIFEIIQVSNFDDTSSAIDEMFIRENIDNVKIKDDLNNKKLLQSSLDKINSQIINLRTLSSQNNDEQKKLFMRKGEIQKSIDLINSNLSEKYPKLSDYLNTKYIGLNDIQNSLQNDDAVIKFISANEKVFIAYLDKNNFELVLSDKKNEELIKNIKKYRGLIENPSSSPDLFSFGKDIYKDLFGGIDGQLNNIKNIYVIMSPLINNLPLETLIKDSNSLKFSDFEWLIKNFNFKYLPTFKSLNSLKSIPEYNNVELEFLGIGDPMLTSLKKNKFNFTSFILRGSDQKFMTFLKELPELPNTADEINRIGKKFKNKKILLREQASEVNIVNKNNSSKFIIFATHALMPNELGKGSLPGLVLTLPDDTKDDFDGLMTTSEIINTNFTSDLIILSACNTAAGDIGNTNSLSGLTKSFFFSGAKNIIASHWSVETFSAEKTTTNLFNQSNENYSDRLRYSKLDLIKKKPTSHPFFWAPFIFIGTN